MRRYRRRYIYEEYDHWPLARDTMHAKLGGVCAGIARYLGVSRFAVRLAAVVSLFIVPQVTLVAYGLAWLIMDEV